MKDTGDSRFPGTICDTAARSVTAAESTRNMELPAANMTTFPFGRPDDLEREKPMLLDPCCPTDPPLLWFDEDGKPAPNPRVCGSAGTFLHDRATTSIQLYHLDHYKIVDRRQQLYQTIKLKMAQAEEKLHRLRENADMTAQQSLAEKVEELRGFMSPDQPYSAAAKCALMALRGSYTVADFVLHGP